MENNYNLPDLGEEIGYGADGQVFLLNDLVIKYSVYFDKDYTNYKKLKQLFDFIKNDDSNLFVKLFSFDYLLSGERDFYTRKQKYIICSCTMEKLIPLNEDEKKVFHTTISHEDGNKLKPITNNTFDMIKELHNFLSFDYNKMIEFHKKLQTSKINHNDLHVRNVMKDSNNNYKLIDFDRDELK
jgi:RIO-like serine/threonine protein kinase